MSLRINIFANYLSQLYVSIVGILILPLYIKYMGAEAYGLVGFFTMLQSWFALLDLGLTPTIARETARFHGGSISALNYRQLYRALSTIFVAVAIAGGSVLWIISDLISYKWLKVDTLDINVVIISVKIMAISVALRWLGGLYRGVISGFERLVWLSFFNTAIATLRFPAVFATMWLYGFTPDVFFWHQLFVSFLELICLFLMSCSLKPAIALGDKIGWSLKPVGDVVKFALTISFTSSVWVLITQTDKMILSGILDLKEYGIFTLAVLVASGIMILSAPVSTVIMPHMVRLNSEGNRDEMLRVYRNATQLVSVIAGSASLTLALLSEQLLYAWTGDRAIAVKASQILSLYALGNGILAVSAFPYYLQYAIGNLRYHLIGNLITLITLIPAIVWASSVYGGVGAGWAWLIINSMYLVFWVGFVHKNLVPNLHISWLIKDIFAIYTPVVIFILLISHFLNSDQTRIESLIWLFLVSISSLLFAILSSSVARSFLVSKLFGVKS
jgi:O-antigen/teichoic acid export membrane protein